MGRPDPSLAATYDDDTGGEAPPTDVVVDRTPDCIVRNYDADRSYDLTITARRVDAGEVAFERPLTVPPADLVGVTDALPPGQYEVEVETAAGFEDDAVCEVDATPAATVLVELGNWHLSVTNGL
jgi:hypothetical protein